MADATVIIGVDGDTSGFSAAMRDAGDAAQRAASQVARDFRRARDRVAKDWGDVRQGLGAVLGGVVGDVEDVTSAMAALGPAGLAAAGALGAAGLTAALYQAAAATGELDDAQAGLQDALGDLSHLAGTAFVDDFDSAIGVLESLARMAQNTVLGLVTLKNIGGAAVSEFATEAGIVYDLLSSSLSGNTEAFEKARQAAIGNQGYSGAIHEAVEETRRWWEETQKVNTETDRSVRGLERQKDAIKDAEKAERDAVAARREAYTATEQLLALTQSYSETSLTAEERAYRQYEQRVEAIVDLGIRGGEVAAQEEAQAAARADYLRQLADLEAQRVEAAAAAHEEILGQIAAETEARDEAVRRGQDAATAAVMSTVDAAQRAAEAVAASAEEGSDAQATALMLAYGIQQSAAITQAIIDGVLLGSSLAVALVPVSGPAAPAIAAGIAAVSTAANLAAIAAAPPPEIAHDGRTVGSRGPLAPTGGYQPDERMVRARVGEEISTRGRESSGGSTVLIRHNHQYYDATEADRIRRPTSPIRREIAAIGKTIPGHR